LHEIPLLPLQCLGPHLDTVAVRQFSQTKQTNQKGRLSVEGFNRCATEILNALNKHASADTSAELFSGGHS